MSGLRVALGDLHLEARWVGPPPEAAPTVVFLHEGLGSVSLWRDFPDRLAAATGCGALVYSRAGYGASDPATSAWPVEFMHHEALVTLPRVLEHFAIHDVTLFGHSDGASIALIYAGARRGPVRGLILEAPHVFVEPICVTEIRRIASEPLASDLRRRLAKHHGPNTETLLRAWTEVWLREEFLHWRIDELLPSIECPTLVIQGRQDAYGTERQVNAVTSAVAGPVETLFLDACGHAPHADRAAEVLKAATQFIRGKLLRPQ
ncbi:MAG: alpha/beta hydrolase [Acidobacteriota bacterium]